MSGSDVSGADETYQRALSLLARRDHSQAELKRKLVAKGFSSGHVEDALERLTRQGYLDDRRFAQRWAESALRSGRCFGTRLLLELQRRGVSREVAAEAVAVGAAEHSERQVLADVVAKRYVEFDSRKASLKERRRVYDYLLRHGFSPAAVNEYFRGNDEDE
ncbi:MAG TPA: regulatory protein RecX [Geobacteraceae bacterium]|nr:regulatory protein RecX [Geobacteraceae bacterium]